MCIYMLRIFMCAQLTHATSASPRFSLISANLHRPHRRIEMHACARGVAGTYVLTAH